MAMAKPMSDMYHCQQKDLVLILEGLFSRKHLCLVQTDHMRRHGAGWKEVPLGCMNCTVLVLA